MTTNDDARPLAAAFLGDMLERPGDDTPRLVYADYLDETAGTVPCDHCGGGRPGEWIHPVDKRGRCATCRGTGRVSDGNAERAEFIKVQVELAGLAGPKTGVITCEGKGPPAHAGSRKRCKCRPCVLVRRERELWLAVSRSVVSTEFHQLLFGNHAVMNRPTEVYNANAAVVVRRGAVAEITLTCAAFLGGPCRRSAAAGVQTCSKCSGEGCSVYGIVANGPCTAGLPCPSCSGTGRTPGHAEQLFRAQPVTRVTLSDKRPLKSEGLEDFRWAERQRSTQNDYWFLPPELFALLLPDINCVLVRDGPAYAARAYHSEVNALRGLSNALVALGRGRAGLPMLTTLRR